MSVEDEPLSPPPQHTKPLDQGEKSVNRGHFEKTWMRWFIELRDKVNVINALVVGFSNLTGLGFPSLNGTTWNLRQLQAGGAINITNPDGVAGDPVISHADTSSAPSLAIDNADGWVIQDLFVTLDTYGHVTGATGTSVDLDLRFVTLATTQTITGRKTFNNDFEISGTARRFTADYSAVNASDRTTFQSSVVNGFTSVCAAPNGTGTIGQYACFNNSNMNSSAFGAFSCSGTGANMMSSVIGGGAAVPLRFSIITTLVAEAVSTAITGVAADALRPGTDNAINLGSAALRWKEVFAVAGAINTSDQNQKTEFRVLTQVELDAAKALSQIVKAFKWKDAVAVKGSDGARWHIGWIAQEVHTIMESFSLDGFAYGFLCYDQWEDTSTPEEVGDDGIIISPATYRPAGASYGLRKDELMAFIIAGQAQRLSRLEELLNG